MFGRCRRLPVQEKTGPCAAPAQGRLRVILVVLGLEEDCTFAANDSNGIPIFDDVDTIRKRESSTIKCPSCNRGALTRREHKERTGFFWSCTAWNEAAITPQVMTKTQR